MAKNADLSFPEVPGRRTAASRAFGRYVARLQAGAVRDAHLGAAFLRVTSMVDPPGALLRPGTVARAMASRAAVTRSGCHEARVRGVTRASGDAGSQALATRPSSAVVARPGCLGSTRTV